MPGCLCPRLADWFRPRMLVIACMPCDLAPVRKVCSPATFSQRRVSCWSKKQAVFTQLGLVIAPSITISAGETFQVAMNQRKLMLTKQENAMPASWQRNRTGRAATVLCDGNVGVRLMWDCRKW